MSVSERALMEAELIDIVEGEFALPVVLRGPDGVTYSTNANDPTGNTPLMGNVLYDSRREQFSESGIPVVIKEMVLTMRRTSVPTRLINPVRGDVWEVLVPQDPTTGAAMTTYILDKSKASGDGRTIGTIRLYLKRATQAAVA
jgi:hypothetical protein